MIRNATALCLFALTAVAGSAFAGAEARMSGVITDAATKKPVPNATIRFVATERRTLDQTFKGQADGHYLLMMLDGTITYMVTFAAPGYAPYQEKMKLKLGEMNTKDVELQPAGAMLPASATGAPAGGAAPKADTNVVAYNEGAKLFNDGKIPEAIAKFKEVVKAKPEMIAAWEALSRAQLRAKDYAGAIESANKALELAPDETDMYAIQYEAYKATGDKAKAAEVKKKLPADAASAFNDAVKLLNEGKDAEAEPLLKQAIAANDKFSQAYYELGMVYVRSGKMAEAKKNLLKYLELEPKGKDADTARESLKYLQ
jgi:tetratricopeptide (TPR) repeat protein